MSGAFEQIGRFFALHQCNPSAALAVVKNKAVAFGKKRYLNIVRDSVDLYRLFKKRVKSLFERRIYILDADMVLRNCNYTSILGWSYGSFFCGDTVAEAPSSDLDATPILLRVPDEIIITRIIEIPKAAASDLRAALDFSISSWTPFDKAEVYFGYECKPSKTAGFLDVEVRLVPKDSLSEYFESAAALKLFPDGLLFGNTPQWVVSLATEKLKTLFAQRNVDRLLLASAVAGVAVLLLVMAIRQNNLVSDLKEKLRADLDSRRAQAENFATVQRANLAITQIVEQSHKYKPISLELSRLTNFIADGAILSNLGFRSGSLQGKYSIPTEDIERASVGNKISDVFLIKSTRPSSSRDSVVEFEMRIK